MKYWAPINSPDGINGNDSYVNGNPSIGVQGSIPTCESFEQPLRGLQNLVQFSAMTPIGAIDDLQISEAIRGQRMNWIGTFDGTVNDLTCTLEPVPGSLAFLTGCPIRGLIAATNTGSMTLAVNGLQAPVVYPDGTPIQAGDLKTGIIAIFIYDGTKFQLVSITTRSLGGDGGASGATGAGGGKVFFNIQQNVLAGRIHVTALDWYTILTTTYNKLSPTSNLFVIEDMPIYVSGAYVYGPYLHKVNIGGITKVISSTNNTDWDGRGNTSGFYLLPGLPAGVLTVNVTLGRPDVAWRGGIWWHATINPNRTDDPWWEDTPALVTTYTFMEIEP